MSKRIGFFVDVSDLYRRVSRKFDGRKLDYKKYYDFVADLGQVQQAIAYGSQLNDEARGFIFCLRNIGFHTKYKEPRTFTTEDGHIRRLINWNVGICMDVVNMVDNLDMVVLGSSDSDLLPLVKWCSSIGLKTIVFSCGVGKRLNEEASEVIEIPESLLEDKSAAVRSHSIQSEGQVDSN